MMSNVSSPGSWVDDMSAVLNKVPQLSNGLPGALNELAAESPAAKGSAAASADDGPVTTAYAEPVADATPSDEDAFAAPAPSTDATAAASAHQAAADAEGFPDTATNPAEGLGNEPQRAPVAAAAAAPALEAATDAEAPEAAATADDAQVPEAQAAAPGDDDTEASGAGFSTPVKAQQPAPTVSLETPAVVRSMTGVAEGFQDPSASAAKIKRSAADVVAASLAEAAPAPANEEEYETFHEAIDEELQLAKEASSAAQAADSPGAADDILAQMSGSHPGTPDPAALAAASTPAADSTAKDSATTEQQENESPQPAAAAAQSDAPASDGSGASVPASDSKADDAAPADVQPNTPAADPASAGNSDLPAAKAATADVKPPEPPSEADETPVSDSVASAPATSPAAALPIADAPQEGPSSPAMGSSAEATGAQVTPEPALTANGTAEQESHETQEPLRTASSIAARIAALKTTPPADEKPPATPDLQAGLPNGDSTPNSVKARIAAMRRTSETLQGDTSPRPSIPRPSPSASPVRRWNVSTPKPPSPSRASGEVVAETVKPKAELKSFWEAHQPADGTPVSPPCRSTADSSNVGRKWQVKLNMPLASGKVSDLSYYRQPKAADASPPPPPPEFKHKIGESTFPLDELKGMSADHGIDPANKELYLSDEDFQTAFAMDKDAFKGKPKWRQVLLKRKVGVF